MAEPVTISNRTMLAVLAVLVAAAVAIWMFTRPSPRTVELPGGAKGLEQAVDRARVAGKPVYLAFFADWCQFCHQMEDQVLTDPEVKQAMTKVEFLAVDYDREKDLVERFGITGIPAGVLLKVDKDRLEVVNQHDGALDKEQFLEFLAAAE